MTRRLALVLLSTGGLTFAQTDADDFARTYNLRPGSYQPATRSALLGVPLPKAGVRLASPDQLTANDLKAYFYTLPARYGWKCAAEQEVLLFPAPGEPDAAITSFLNTSGAQVLSQVKGGAASFTLAGSAFATLQPYRGSFLLASCKAARETGASQLIPANFAKFVGNTPYLVTLDRSGDLLWCPEGGVLPRRVRAFSGSATYLDVSSDGSVIAAAGFDAGPVVKVYRAADGSLVGSLKLDAQPLALRLASDNRSLWTFSADRTVTQYDLTTLKPRVSWRLSGTTVPAIIPSVGNRVALIERGNLLRVYDTTSGRAALVSSTGTLRASGAAFSPDGRWFVTTTTGGLVRTVDTASWTPGPSVSLGVPVAPSVLPGRSGAEVFLYTVQKSAGAPDRLQPWTWTVGEAQARKGDVVVRLSGEPVAMNATSGRPYPLTPCRAAP